MDICVGRTILRGKSPLEVAVMFTTEEIDKFLNAFGYMGIGACVLIFILLMYDLFFGKDKKE